MKFLGIFKKDQDGKITIEKIAWVLVTLIFIAIGAAVVASVITNKSDGAQRAVSIDTLICPPGSIAFDVRPYMPNGIPLSGTTNVHPTAGAVGSSGKIVIANSPFVDIDGSGGAGDTAEFVCVAADIGH